MILREDSNHTTLTSKYSQKYETAPEKETPERSGGGRCWGLEIKGDYRRAQTLHATKLYVYVTGTTSDTTNNKLQLPTDKLKPDWQQTCQIILQSVLQYNRNDRKMTAYYADHLEHINMTTDTPTGSPGTPAPNMPMRYRRTYDMGLITRVADTRMYDTTHPFPTEVLETLQQSNTLSTQPYYDATNNTVWEPHLNNTQRFTPLHTGTTRASLGATQRAAKHNDSQRPDRYEAQQLWWRIDERGQQI